MIIIIIMFISVIIISIIIIIIIIIILIIIIIILVARRPQTSQTGDRGEQAGHVARRLPERRPKAGSTANLRTTILDFRGVQFSCP